MTLPARSKSKKPSASQLGRKKYSPLTALGYKTGIRAPLTRERQRKLLRAFRVDLRDALSDEEYLESGACRWGAARSELRKWQVVSHLRWQLEIQDRRQHHDATKQLRADLDFAERELL